MTRYADVADAIWRDAADDGVDVGGQLPSERVLTQTHGVSRETVRSALRVLAERGLIRPSSSRGWFVESRPRSHRTTPRHTVLGFADYARQNGLPTTTVVLHAGIRPARVDEAETLRIAPGASLFDMRRLRLIDGLPVVVEHNRVPARLCPSLGRTDFAHASLYATLRAADPPQYPQMARYSVEARPPEDDEADLLELDTEVPMLVATQLAFNQDRRPLEYTVAVYRGDRYRFQAAITD